MVERSLVAVMLDDANPEIAWAYEPGWFGAFTRQQAKGAWPNGTRIVKADGEPKDGTPIGVEGVVLGSLRDAKLSPNIFYFVEWDDKPKIAVGVTDWKIAKVPA